MHDHWRGSDEGEEAVWAFRYPLYDEAVTGSEDGRALAPLLGRLTGFDGGATSVHLGPASFCLSYADHGVIYRFVPKTPETSDMEVIWLVRSEAREGIDRQIREHMAALTSATNTSELQALTAESLRKLDTRTNSGGRLLKLGSGGGSGSGIVSTVPPPAAMTAEPAPGRARRWLVLAGLGILGASVALILLMALVALPHLQRSDLFYVDVPFLHGQPFRPALLGLIFGVMLATYFGHLSVGNCAKVVLRRDGSARALIWGGIAAQLTTAFLYCVWVFANVERPMSAKYRSMSAS